MPRTSRLVPQVSLHVLGKHIHDAVPGVLHQSLQAAGINPELIKAQVPAIMAAFVPALANAVNQALHQQGGFVGAFEGSPLFQEIQRHAPNTSTPMSPIPVVREAAPVRAPSQQNGTGFPPDIQSGDQPPSLTDAASSFQ